MSLLQRAKRDRRTDRDRKPGGGRSPRPDRRSGRPVTGCPAVYYAAFYCTAGGLPEIGDSGSEMQQQHALPFFGGPTAMPRETMN
jgi:hypothetical protein